MVHAPTETSLQDQVTRAPDRHPEKEQPQLKPPVLELYVGFRAVAVPGE